MNFRNQHNGTSVVSETFTLESVTVQNDSLSLAEIVRRLQNNTLQASDILRPTPDDELENLPGDIFGATLDELQRAQEILQTKIEDEKHKQDIEIEQPVQPAADASQSSPAAE